MLLLLDKPQVFLRCLELEFTELLLLLGRLLYPKIVPRSGLLLEKTIGRCAFLNLLRAQRQGSVHEAGCRARFDIELLLFENIKSSILMWLTNRVICWQHVLV